MAQEQEKYYRANHIVFSHALPGLLEGAGSYLAFDRFFHNFGDNAFVNFSILSTGIGLAVISLGNVAAGIGETGHNILTYRAERRLQR